jgi:hypothetical protein
MSHGGPSVSPDPTVAAHAPDPPLPAPPPPVVSAAPAPAQSTVSSTTTVAPVTGAESNDVHLHVVTDPPGAKVSKDGFQVCEATPCDVTIPRNTGIELVAQKGAMLGRSKILPQRDETVTIALAAPVQKPKPAGPKMCEIEVSGIKVFRECPK